MKGRIGYIIGIVALLGILVFAETNVPQEADWRATFSAYDKIPYGSYVLRHSLDDLFPDAQVTNITKSYFQEWLNDNFESSGPLVIITQDFYPDSLNLSLIYEHAAAGNTVLVAAENFAHDFVDSLHVEFAYNFNLKDTTTNLSVQLNNNWGPNYLFTKLSSNQWFELDSISLAEAIGKGNDFNNFVRIPYGDGSFLLHSQPRVFTNYHVLYNQHQYQERLLSWLGNDVDHIYWDEYYKPYREEINTPLKVILSIPALRAAYWTLLIGLIIYIISNVRRRQRAIPVLKPKPNLSLDFLQTIGLLYYDQKDHKNLATKIYAVFTEHIQSQYFLRYEKTERFYKQLAAKSGVPEQLIQTIFESYQQLQNKNQISEEELISINRNMEEFYRLSKHQASTKK